MYLGDRTTTKGTKIRGCRREAGAVEAQHPAQLKRNTATSGANVNLSTFKQRFETSMAPQDCKCAPNSSFSEVIPSEAHN
jgi:hypothetical protein